MINRLIIFLLSFSPNLFRDYRSEVNQHLHQRLEEAQKKTLKAKTSDQEEMKRIQKDHQATQLQLNDQKDMLQKFKLEKLAADKQQKSQAIKISALERRLQDSLSVFPSTPKNSNNNNTPGTVNNTDNSIGGSTNNAGEGSSRLSDASRGFAIPRLGRKENESTSMKLKCAVCFKDASSGLLMKKCQCGQKGCKIKAHAACLKHISTPANGQLVLCSIAVTASFSSNNMGFSNPTAITPK